MSEYTSYYLYQKYQKIGDGDWTPVSPSVFSIDGEGTMPLNKKQDDDPNCGYVPEAIYRWVNMDISTNWVCDDCPIPQYRTVSTAYTCVGYDKHYLNEYQVSYNSGATWITTATTTGDLIEANSEYCGYVPPTPPIPTGTKFSASYSGGETYSAECDSNTTLTTATTKPGGYEIFSSEMTNAVIGDCVTNIGVSAFTGCKILSSITMPNSVTSISESAFTFCSGFTSIVIPSGVTTIGDNSFRGCYSLTNIVIPDSVTSIDYQAFCDCYSLTSCTIGSGVTSFGRFGFGYCVSLKNVDIHYGVTSIGTQAFIECRSLSSITIPNSVETIGSSAFGGCSGLTSIDIPDSVTWIGNYAFSDCSSLTGVTVNAITPPTLESGAFNVTNNCPIYVPAASVNAYKSASGWSAYARRITAIPNS